MMTNFKYLFSGFLICFSLSLSAQEIVFRNLFKNRFFTLSQDAALLCATSSERFFSPPELREIINYYEQRNSPELRKLAVQLLTNHINPEFKTFLQESRAACTGQDSIDLCVLGKYWDSEEAALRVLALFYDTRTIIKHNDDYDFPRFNADHLRSFEKALRKIPPFMRKIISRAKPIRNLKKFIKAIDPETQALILQAFPKDTETMVWVDDTHPLSILPGKGFRSQVVAQVFNGRNSIVFTIKGFDKAKDGKIYRDIDLKYLVDFRLPLIIHEMAHVIDNFYFWNGKDDLYFFYRYRKMTTDAEFIQIINDARLALWPSKWFEAFEYLAEVHKGRYNGRTEEKLAELMSQYILIPQRLRLSSPATYMWLRDDVFRGVEYQGYGACGNQITRKLSWWEDAVAVQLGR